MRRFSDRLTKYWNTNFDRRKTGENETAGSYNETENIGLLQRIARLREKGIDIDAILDAVDPDKQK